AGELDAALEPGHAAGPLPAQEPPAFVLHPLALDDEDVVAKLDLDVLLVKARKLRRDDVRLVGLFDVHRRGEGEGSKSERRELERPVEELIHLRPDIHGPGNEKSHGFGTSLSRI